MTLRTTWSIFIALALVSGIIVGAARADDNDRDDGGGFAVREDDRAVNPQMDDEDDGKPDEGVVRMARFSYVSGNVTWRPDGDSNWGDATINLPLREGAQIWVTEGGRAEIQFDDGSLLRMGSGALFTMSRMFSDADGAFTEIKLQTGLIALRTKHERSLYQVETPFAAVRTSGAARLRIGVGDEVEIGVRGGDATVEGEPGKTTLRAGDYLLLRDEDTPFVPRTLPAADNFEGWNLDRDRALEMAETSATRRNLPSNIAICADNLDSYGTWRYETEYGNVWCPRVSSSDWRPYADGRWTWVSPFGWTWVSYEPWGWAPYHYGTWARLSYGWCWVPGPSHQYWSPGVVHFSECDGRIGWAPLAPRDVRYPASLSVGYRHGNWSLYFSIGGCAVYSARDNYCEPRPWRTRYVNRVTRVTNVTNIYNNTTVINNNRGLNRFISVNATSGTTVAGSGGFGRRGGYERLQNGSSFFRDGYNVNAASGNRPFSGPSQVRPTTGSWNASDNFRRRGNPPQNISTRPVFQGSLPTNVAQNDNTRRGGNWRGNDNRRDDDSRRDGDNRGNGNWRGNNRTDNNRTDNNTTTWPGRAVTPGTTAPRPVTPAPSVSGSTTGQTQTSPQGGRDRDRNGDRDDNDRSGWSRRRNDGYGRGTVVTPNTAPPAAATVPPVVTVPPAGQPAANNNSDWGRWRDRNNNRPADSGRVDSTPNRTSPSVTTPPSTPAYSGRDNNGRDRDNWRDRDNSRDRDASRRGNWQNSSPTFGTAPSVTTTPGTASPDAGNRDWGRSRSRSWGSAPSYGGSRTTTMPPAVTAPSTSSGSASAGQGRWGGSRTTGPAPSVSTTPPSTSSSTSSSSSSNDRNRWDNRGGDRGYGRRR